MKTIVSLLFILISSSFTFGASFVVNNNGDTSDANPSDNLCLDSNGNCTLRAAIEQANALASDDVITFANDITLITLTNEIRINNVGSLTINGRGANVLTIDGGAGTNRIFFTASATVAISKMTMQDGNGTSVSASGQGGAILASAGSLTLDSVVIQNNGGGTTIGEGSVAGCGVNFNQGTHRILNSTFRGNMCSQAGAFILNSSNLFMANSTISGNTSTINGPVVGGGAIISNGGLSIINSTITNNAATSRVGGVFQGMVGSISIGNTIIAGNTAREVPDFQNVGGSSLSLGNNLFGNSFANGILYKSTDIRDTAPLLGSLTIINGGTTPTHALLNGSPAIDAGGNSLAVAPFNNPPLVFDQRGPGFPRIIDGNNDGVATVDIGAFELQSSGSPARTRFDFDGDGRSDLAVFRPSNGFWYILRSQTNSFQAVQFGQQNDQIAPGDYDGDGKADVAVWRGTVPGAGNFAYFYILNSSDNSFLPVQFGATGDVPVTGDWDGDGKSDLAVYRDGSLTGGQSSSYYRPSSSPGTNFRAIPWGSAGDKPQVGDFDGDGKLDAAVFRPSTADWYILRSSTNQVIQINFGVSTDIPTPADFNGDGQANIAVFRPSNGTWYTSTNPQTNYGAIQFGANGDLPVPADYDGDGRADVAVFRPSNGTWYLLRSTQGFTGVQFGLSGDKPVPNAFIR